jgi:hypothetical protein
VPHVLLGLCAIISDKSLQNKHCSAPLQIVNLVRFQPPRLKLNTNPGVKGAKLGLQWLCSLRADHTFGPVIQIWKDLGYMYFFSCGQSISLTLNYFNIKTMLGTPH